MELTERGPCNNFLSILFALLIENSVSSKFPVCGNVKGVMQGGNQPAGVSFTIRKITIVHCLSTYPLLIHWFSTYPFIIQLPKGGMGRQKFLALPSAPEFDFPGTPSPGRLISVRQQGLSEFLVKWYFTTTDWPRHFCSLRVPNGHRAYFTLSQCY